MCNLSAGSERQGIEMGLQLALQEKEERAKDMIRDHMGPLAGGEIHSFAAFSHQSSFEISSLFIELPRRNVVVSSPGIPMPYKVVISKAGH